ncbi:uncharacterized protein [Diabrotica undecimpunctata]|uniref:uncharacterized protein n=1 Tax=Diabrotica undecimpunctata TaxID=50387 RepID=UPI003B63E275
MKNEMKSSVASTSTNNRNDPQSSQKSSAPDDGPEQAVVNKDIGKTANSISDTESTSFGNGAENDIVKKTSMETTDNDIIAIFTDTDDPIFSTKTDRSGSTNDKYHFKAGASTSKMSTNQFQDNNGNLEQEDVSKILKLLSKPNLTTSPWDKRNNSKTPLKTYGNPRKSLKKSAIIESFGLPDTSIIPEKPSKPSILDANVSDASEITIQALQFGDDSWCVDFPEDFLLLSEIRVKARPQNHVLVSKSLNSSTESSDPVNPGSSAINDVKNKQNHVLVNKSLDSSTEVSSPVKQGSSAISDVKNKQNHVKVNKSLNSSTEASSPVKQGSSAISDVKNKHNHVLVNKSLNSSTEASSPVKQGSSAISDVKNKFNGAIANSKLSSNYLLKNDVNISPNKSDIVVKKNNLTIDEHEVEFFSSNGTSTPNSTTVKTNRLDKNVQKDKESHRSKSTPNTRSKSESYIDQTPTNDTPRERRTLRSDVTKDNTNKTKNMTPHKSKELILLESQCSGETRTLRSSTAPSTPSEPTSQCSGETRKLRSSTAPSTPSEPTNCSKTNEVFSKLTVNLQTDFKTTKTTPVLKTLTSTDFNKQQLMVNITKETSAFSDKPKAKLTKTTSNPDIRVSNKEKNEKMKCVSDSEVSRNEDYLKQLKIILHPLRTPTEAPKAKQTKRRSTRLNNSQHDSKTTNEKKSGSREMILQLIDVIPVPDKEEYKSPLLKNPAFLKLFQKEECPLLDVFMNKEQKIKVKANRKQEPKSCGPKPNSTTHNLPSTSKNEDLPVIGQNTCSKSKESHQQALEVKAIDHDKSNTEPQCSTSDQGVSRIQSVEETDANKSPTPKSPTKFSSKLKKSPEILELKNIIQKISESEGRRCKVTTNEKLSECLKSRHYNKKPSSSTSNLTDSMSSNSSLKELEAPDKVDLNSVCSPGSSTNHFLSPTDNLRGRTRRIIEMLVDDDHNTCSNQKSASDANQSEIKSVLPVETTHTTTNELQESTNDSSNSKPVKNQTSSKVTQAGVESIKKVNRSNKLLLSEEEINRDKENKSRSSIIEPNIENLEPKIVPKQSNQNVPTENLQKQDNNTSNSAEGAVSVESHDILICKETEMSCNTTQTNIETENGRKNTKSTKSGEDKDRVCTVRLAKTEETKGNLSDTLNVAQNNDNTLKPLDTSRSTAKENDLGNQNGSLDSCSVPKAFLQRESKEKEQNSAVVLTKDLDISREQKEIKQHVTVGVKSSLESNKTDGDKLDLTLESNNLLLSKRRSTRSQGQTSKNHIQVQQELERECTEVLENHENAQKGEAMSTPDIAPVERRAGRSSKYTLRKEVATEIKNGSDSLEALTTPPILDANQCQETDKNEAMKSPDFIPKEKAGRRSKHTPHRRDVANTTENETDSLKTLTTPPIVSVNQSQQTEKIGTFIAQDITPGKHKPNTITSENESSSVKDLTKTPVLNASECQEVENKETPKTPGFTPKGKAGRRSKHTPQKREVTNTTNNETNALNTSPIINANQFQQVSPDTPKMTLSEPDKRDVTDPTEHESGSLNAVTSLVLNTTQCQKVDKNETLLSPDITPKRKSGRSNKTTPSRPDGTDTTDNASQCQKVEKNETLLPSDTTPKRRLDKTIKDTALKREVTDTTQNESAPQVMLSPNLPQNSENNGSTDTKEPIDSGKSQNDTLDVTTMNDSSGMLSPLGTPKRKRGRPRKHSIKEDNSQSKLTEHNSLLDNSPVLKNGQKNINTDDDIVTVKRRSGRPRKTMTEEEMRESIISNCEDLGLSQRLDANNERSTLQVDKIVDDLKIRINGQIKSKNLLKNNNSNSILENSQETEYTSTQNVPTLFTGRKETSNQSENLLDEEVSTINKLTSTETTKSSSNEDNKELKRAKTSLDEKLEQNNEFASTGKLKDLDKTSPRELLADSPRKTRYSRRISDFHEEAEEIIPARRRRSKSCLLGRISDIATDDDDWCRKTRSRTSLGDNIFYTTDDEGESDCENNVSRRTRSKTSLGERISSGDREDFVQNAKLRSKSSLGQARSFVEHDILPRRRTRRSSSVNQSLPLEEKRQSRNMIVADAEETRFKSNSDVKVRDTSGKLNDSSKENIVDGGKKEMSTRKKKAASTNESSGEALPYAKPSTSRRSIQSLKHSQRFVKRRHTFGSKSDIMKRFKTIYKQEHKPFLPQLGDFVWAQFSNYPYWPSFVSNEPDSGLFTKMAKQGLSERTVYHVNFFGDKGRSAWIYNKKLMAYKSKDDLEKRYNTLQEFKAFAEVKACFVRSSLIKRWTAAVDELEYVKASGFDFKQITRFLELTNVLSDEESTTDEDIKSEKINLSIEESSQKKLSKGKKSLDDQEDIVHVQKKIKLEIDSPPTSKQKLTRKKLVKDSSELSSEASYPLTMPKKEEPNDDDEINKDDSIEHKLNANTQRHFGSYSIDEQKALYKRNNLFKGVPREKVCHYCFESGDLLRCKGGCNGLYHRYCASQVLVEKYPKRRKFRTSPVKTESTAKVENLKPEAVESISPTATSPGVVEEPAETPPVKASETSEVDETHVQIVTVPSFRYESPPKKTFPPDFVNMSLADRIDFKMKEIMGKFESTTYLDILSESSSDERGTSSPVMKTTPENDVNKTSLPVKPLDNNRAEESQSSNGQNVREESMNADVDYTKDHKLTSKHKAPTKHVTADCRSITHSKDPSHRVNGFRNPFAKHVTADSEIVLDSKTFKCGFCVEDIDPYCFICNEMISKKGALMRQKCSLHPCPRFYHPDCLKLWPQTQWSLIQTTKNRFSQEEQDSFVCPQHVCHTCASDDPRAAISRCPWDKIVKCLCCPASYHSTNFCIPAGTAIVSTTQIVCPRHRYRTKPYTINTTWCLLCNEGGNLICCETCPTSVHPECMTVNLTDDDRFICEDCESGRLPLYDEVVWVKLGNYKWWPSLIIFPNEIPPKVQSTKHHPGEFVVKFFGTYDYYWMNRGRAFLFQEGDTIDNGINTKKKFQAAFTRAVEEAVVAHQMKKQFKILQAAETAVSMKPPPYIKIKVSKPVGNVRLTELDLSNTTACECDPHQVNPCGPDSNCLNRLLLTECHPEVCPAGKHCKNQSFEKREYPTLVPYRTETRGWGLKTLEPIKKGQFVIEYVGELIDDEEYQRRIQKMHEQKEENYYFLTIYKDRMIDAGPKGNIARFMNHCCQPNCETQKWTVNGNTRVGLFATGDIPANTELTFNYNLECTGTEKKVCKCGAPNCSGFIGVKAKNDSTELRKPKKEKKKKEPEKPMELPPCYICQRKGRVSLCNNKICNKAYHLRCLKLKERPDSKKFVCPWHYCNVCSKRTIRCCVKCLNSFCPSHSEGNVRYDNLMGFVCHTHDPTNATSQAVNVTIRKRRSNNVTDEAQVSSTTTDNDDIDAEADSLTCRKSRKSKKTVVEEDENIDFDISESCTSSPLKGTDDDSQDETVSSATVSDFEEEIRPKRKKKQIKKLRSKKRKLKFSNRKTITANSVNDTTESNLNVDM